MPSLRALLRAELAVQWWWLKNNRVMLLLSFAWPYMAVLVLLGMGYAYGSVENMAERLGVDEPLVYLMAASMVAFAASGIIDNASGVAQWHRWLGTLPYVYASPHRFPVYLVVSGFAGSLFIAVTDLAAMLPGALLAGGPRASAGLMAVFAVMILASLPLVGIAATAALLSLLAREEGNVLSFLNPLLLLLSGVFYPVEVLPRLLQALSALVPVRYVVEAARVASSFSGGPMRAVVVASYYLAAMIVVYNTLSAHAVAALERGARRRGVL
ncbi:MAG: ABC transporter permease [Desulfurococcales archaeon]|nr:ABC transporter permease [Desulfurococcales archaeon]